VKDLQIHKYWGEILLVLSVLIGLITYQNYGASWDEPQQRATGIVNYDYIFTESTQLHSWVDRDYGVAFELPLIIIEKTFHPQSDREIYQMRHLISHLLFLISAYFFYRLIFFLHKKALWAVIGFLLYTTHPVIYGHSFFNSKDLPFLSIFTITLYFLAKSFNDKRLLNFLVLGIFMGILVNIRLMGIMVPVLVVFFMVIDGIIAHKILRHLSLTLCMSVMMILVLYLTWPNLWADPIVNFKQALENMSQFRFNREMMFMGSLVKPTEIPWTYIPTWMGITTPIPYLILGLTGGVLLLKELITSPSILLNSRNRNNLFAGAFFLFPILAIIYLHSVLYDGWRQMYFVYPPFIILAIYGLNKLKAFPFWNKISLTIISIGILYTLGFHIQNRYLQHTYFNAIISSQDPDFARKNFEVDYWGVSYKQGLEYILMNDTAYSIKISVANFPGYLNESMLSTEQDDRIVIGDLNEADYFLTEYRFHPHEYDRLDSLKFHALRTSNNTTLQIFKLK